VKKIDVFCGGKVHASRLQIGQIVLR